MATSRLCSIPDCGKPHYGRNKCKPHYQSDRYYGRIEVAKHARFGQPMAFAKAALTQNTDDCILWPYGKRHGYGILIVDKKNWPAHRWVCEQAHGAPPQKYVACHSCDVRACINPRHLRWGTVRDNHEDCEKRGRRLWGERNPQSVLTFAQVMEIRASKATRAELAAQYGVSEATITVIDSGDRWTHSPDGEPLTLMPIRRKVAREVHLRQLAEARTHIRRNAKRG